MKHGITHRRQSGMTQIAWILAIVFMITAFVLVIRLIPPYLEHMSVKESLKSIAKDPSIKGMSAHKVRELFTRRLYVNSVKSISANALEISREGSNLVLQVDYEVRLHAIGNIDMVLKFNDKVQVE